MYCNYCDKEITVGEHFFRLRETVKCFCSIDCMTDYMILNGEVFIETNTSEEDE
jgi:hypothetical protein